MAAAGGRLVTDSKSRLTGSARWLRQFPVNQRSWQVTDRHCSSTNAFTGWAWNGAQQVLALSCCRRRGPKMRATAGDGSTVVRKTQRCEWYGNRRRPITNRQEKRLSTGPELEGRSLGSRATPADRLTPPHQRNVPQEKSQIHKRGPKWGPICGTESCFWSLTPPLQPRGLGGGGVATKEWPGVDPTVVFLSPASGTAPQPPPPSRSQSCRQRSGPRPQAPLRWCTRTPPSLTAGRSATPHPQAPAPPRAHGRWR